MRRSSRLKVGKSSLREENVAFNFRVAGNSFLISIPGRQISIGNQYTIGSVVKLRFIFL